MDGVPMVQPTPFPSGQLRAHRHLHCCKYCKELSLAKTIQPTAKHKEIIVMTLALLSLGPLAYYIWSGSEAAFAAWILSVVLVWVL